MVPPNIWKPPQIPRITGESAATRRASSASRRPRPRSEARSETVARVPGSTTRSGRPNSSARATQRTCTPGSATSGSRSVKLDRRGSSSTATSSRFVAAGAADGVGDRASESSASNSSPSRKGNTPSVGTPVRASSWSGPSPSRAGSPRNRLMTKPPIARANSSGRMATVPKRWANTPPRSMSPTTMAGRPARTARPRFTMSCCNRLISAGLPAPSQTTTSYRARSDASAPSTTSTRVSLEDWYEAASCRPAARPSTTTWEARSPVGLSRTGFMATSGSAPAATAWSHWARPISPPSPVTMALSDMFWPLKGATATPCRARTRQSPATTVLLPASEVVPQTINAPFTAAVLSAIGPIDPKRHLTGHPSAHKCVHTFGRSSGRRTEPTGRCAWMRERGRLPGQPGRQPSPHLTFGAFARTPKATTREVTRWRSPRT